MVLDKNSTFSAVGERYGSIRKKYDQILKHEAYDAFLQMNERFTSCWSDSSEWAPEEATYNALFSSLDSLEELCKQAAEARMQGEKKNPTIDMYITGLPLSTQDEQFKDEKRNALKAVTPLTGRLLLADEGESGSWDWALDADEEEPNYAYSISEGDRLLIYNPDGSVYFDDIMIRDTTSSWCPLDPKYPYGYGKLACPYPVSWTPKGISPRDWLKIFFHARKERLRAELFQLPSTKKTY